MTSRRRIVAALAVSAALGAASVPATVEARTAAPPPDRPTSAQRLFDRTADWLVAHDIPVHRVVVSWGVSDEHHEAEVRWDRPGDVAINATSRPWYAYPSHIEAEVAVHELLHQVSRDESAVEAVARDLTPFVSRAILGLTGVSIPAVGAYQAGVVQLRRDSIAATGKPWPSAAAIYWRRAHLFTTAGGGGAG